MDYRNSLIENNKIIYGLIDEVKKLKNIGGNDKNNYDNIMILIAKIIGILIGLMLILYLFYYFECKGKKDKNNS